MDDNSTTRRRRRTAGIVQAYRDSHEILSAAVLIAICAGGGYWLDEVFGLKPLLMIFGLAVGCLMAVVMLRRLLIRLDQRVKCPQNRSSSQSASGERQNG